MIDFWQCSSYRWSPQVVPPWSGLFSLSFALYYTVLGAFQQVIRFFCGETFFRCCVSWYVYITWCAYTVVYTRYVFTRGGGNFFHNCAHLNRSILIPSTILVISSLRAFKLVLFFHSLVARQPVRTVEDAPCMHVHPSCHPHAQPVTYIVASSLRS